MSLNWKEIDAVLAELPLVDAFIRKVIQPDFRNLILSCYHRSHSFDLLICLEPKSCRMHRISQPPPKARQAQRFMQILRSRLQGGKIIDVEHVNRDRIVKFSVRQGGTTCLLWVRLWGTAANVILTDQDGQIYDAFFRRPGRAEITGEHYQPQPPRQPPDDSFRVRDLPGEGDFNSRIERWYRDQNRQQRLQLARERLQRQLQQEQRQLQQRLTALRDQVQVGEPNQSWKLLGDLIMSNLHRIEAGMEWITVDDYTRPGSTVTIQLDPTATPAENAQRYYTKQKKAHSSRQRALDEIENVERRMRRLVEQMEQLESEQDPRQLEQQLKRPSQDKKSGAEAPPGLSFESHGFQILVGRTAKENDLLLRRFVRGNDTWLHARDYPGGYVFIKHRSGKSVPLDTLLDAANLALAYSKGRSDGDVYYTQVKYLRRAKHGKTGTVIPTQEKNLSVRLDQARLRRLKHAADQPSQEQVRGAQ